MESQIQVWIRELGILKALLENTRGDFPENQVEEVHCLIGRIRDIARDMERAVARHDDTTARAFTTQS